MRRFPWAIASVFGLLHGLAFADALRATDLPPQAVPLALGAFANGRADPVVRAGQVELLNRAGARQAVLSADSAGVTLTLFGPRGKPVSAVQLGDSALTLLDATGEPVATLGGPRVKHLVE